MYIVLLARSPAKLVRRTPRRVASVQSGCGRRMAERLALKQQRRYDQCRSHSTERPRRTRANPSRLGRVFPRRRVGRRFPVYSNSFEVTPPELIVSICLLLDCSGRKRSNELRRARRWSLTASALSLLTGLPLRRPHLARQAYRKSSRLRGRRSTGSITDLVDHSAWPRADSPSSQPTDLGVLGQDDGSFRGSCRGLRWKVR